MSKFPLKSPSFAFVKADPELIRALEEFRNYVISSINDSALSPIASIPSPTQNDQIIVSTGPDTFQLESGDTARTSLGLGSSDAVTHKSLNLSGSLTVNGAVLFNSTFTSRGINDDATEEKVKIEDDIIQLETETAIGSGYTSKTVVEFDGTNDYLLRGGALTGISDGKKGTLVCRVKANTISNNRNILNATKAGANVFQLLNIVGSDKWNLSIRGVTGSNNDVYAISSTTAVVDTWYNIFISWDVLNDTDPLMFINEANVLDAAASALTNDTLDYSAFNDWCVGANIPGNSAKWHGQIDFIWMDLTQKLDVSDAAVRRKFIDSNGNPVDLGVSGEIPTGTAPILYLSGGQTDFLTNKGTGGNFTEYGDLSNIEDIDNVSKVFIGDSGIYLENIIGGAKGAGYINMHGYYVDGVEMSPFSTDDVEDAILDFIVGSDSITLIYNPDINQLAVKVYPPGIDLSEFNNSLKYPTAAQVMARMSLGI
jgi:hypothetical protein